MLDRHFRLAEQGVTMRGEIFAGLTTFLTMVYIVVVNPAILGDAGLPPGAVAVATCLAAGFGSILMGLASNYPLAMAPGMGLNAYFAYTVVKGMGLPWQTALGCVFLSGLAFLILTLTGVRGAIVRAIPRSLFSAVAGGIGLFIAFIGLKDAGIVVGSPATFVSLGRLASPAAITALVGLVVIAVLQARQVKGAMLIGIAVAAGAGWLLGLARPAPVSWGLGDLSATAFRLNIGAAMNLRSGLVWSLVEIVFVFLFVDLFDNLGTLVGVARRAGLIDANGHIPRLQRILLADSIAAMAGAVAGVSTVTSYVESAAGVAAGGRTGLTAVVVGLLFLLTLFVAPLAAVIPTAAAAPALIIVGALMAGAVVDIDWNDPAAAIPAFLTVVMIPLTFSIANGLAFGLVAHALMKVASGRAGRADAPLFALAALCAARFIYLAV
ncbi:MAG TPA: NCS2 family permease [Caulobacteraceae bacterium]|nr:NCS2 family permease [Caulobacteraceae bacterium]